jgi:hypothetical protein
MFENVEWMREPFGSERKIVKKSLERHAYRAVGVLAIGLLSGLLCSPQAAFAAWTVGKPIVTYYGGPWLGDESARQMAAGGWNLVWVDTAEQLDVAQAHGLRAMWRGSKSEATIKSIRNHPALHSYYVFDDEPPASHFQDLASQVSYLRGLDPNHMAYINLFPTYASDAQLGTSGYRQYLSQYISEVKPSLLSYDHYPFLAGSDRPDYFKNLAVVSHTAKQAGIPFLQVVQACSWDSSVRIPNGNELRYLYNTSLAYGAQGVSDFVYSLAGFSGGMAGADGVATTLYDSAKTTNRQFVAIAEQIQSLKHIGAYHVGDLPPGYGTTDGSSPLRLPGNSPFTVSGIPTTNYRNNQPVRGAVLGLFSPDDLLADATRTLVVNLNYSTSLNTRVTGPGDLSVFDPTTGTWIAQGHAWADVSLLPGGGVLVGLTATVPEPSSWTLLGMGVVGLFWRGWRKGG